MSNCSEWCFVYIRPVPLFFTSVWWKNKMWKTSLLIVLLCFLAVQLFTAAILQGLSNNGAVPLYYELAIENTYPVPEVCVSTIMTIVYNILPLLFLLIFLIPNVGEYRDLAWLPLAVEFGNEVFGFWCPHWLLQWFSIGVPQNLRVPQALARGSTAVQYKIENTDWIHKRMNNELSVTAFSHSC